MSAIASKVFEKWQEAAEARRQAVRQQADREAKQSRTMEAIFAPAVRGAQTLEEAQREFIALDLPPEPKGRRISLPSKASMGASHRD